MSDFEDTLRAAMHSAVDGQEASHSRLISQVRRRHRRHNLAVGAAAGLLVLAGGLSAEREVSLRSGHRVRDALAEAGIDAVVADADGELLTQLRAEHQVFRRRRFFRGKVVRRGQRLGDIAWFTLAGEEMTDHDWDAGFAKSLTVFVNGRAISEPDRRGGRISDDSFLLLFNASEQDLVFTIPPRRYGQRWAKALDTALPAADFEHDTPIKPGDVITVINHSLQVLSRD